MTIGQIIREYGQTLEVEHEGQIETCFARKNTESLVIGDFVEFSQDLHVIEKSDCPAPPCWPALIAIIPSKKWLPI